MLIKKLRCETHHSGESHLPDKTYALIRGHYRDIENTKANRIEATVLRLSSDV